MWMKKIWVASLGTMLVAMVLGLPNGALAQTIQEIYVFGDSLSDGGNVLKATQGETPTDPPYFRGRYSNGPVWVDYLASQLKLTTNLENNFAYGGATTGASRELPLGVITQIQRFTTTHSSANPKALYIVWAGANDYFRGTADPSTPVNNLMNAVQSLVTAGAKNIVVLNLPDLGKVPATQTTERSASLSNLTQQHNSQLAASINRLDQQLSPDINLTYLDVNSLFNQVRNQPQEFGFTNVTTPCFTNGQRCNSPNQYLFWDGIHPTTAAHKILAEFVLSRLKVSAEPSPVSTSILPVTAGVVVLSALGTVFVLNRKKAFNH